MSDVGNLCEPARMDSFYIDAAQIKLCTTYNCARMSHERLCRNFSFPQLIWHLTSDQLPRFRSLETVIINSCPGTSLDVRECTGLTLLDLHTNHALLHVLASGCNSLRPFNLIECGVRSVDVGGCSALEHFSCTVCRDHDSLDLASCHNLLNVWCSKISTCSLHVSSAAAATLAKISCSESSMLRRLCLTHCSRLSELDFAGCMRLSVGNYRMHRYQKPALQECRRVSLYYSETGAGVERMRFRNWFDKLDPVASERWMVCAVPETGQIGVCVANWCWSSHNLLSNKCDDEIYVAVWSGCMALHK